MKIDVRQEYVATAVKRDSHHCMIADAIKDQAHGSFIIVDLQSIRWSNLKTGKRYCYLTPPAAQAAIIAFDQGKPVKPFAFTLRNPVRVRKVMRQWTGDPEVLKKARAKYKKRGRRSTRPEVPSRHREFGVRTLEA